MNKKIDLALLRQYWCDVYLKRGGSPYYWSAKDAGALKQLANKLSTLDSSANINDLFRQLVDKLPEWYIIHAYSVAVINGKFNEIINLIKRNNEQVGGVSKKSTGVSDDYLARAARRAAGAE